MLFMGEEWGAAQPFPYFCDFDGPLGDAIRDGRRKEFARFAQFKDPAQRDKIPDPLAEATFLSAKLDWSAIDADVLGHYRALIAARREHVMPLIPLLTHGGAGVPIGPSAVEVRWAATGGQTLILAANLSNAAVDHAVSGVEPFWTENPSPAPLGPWEVRWSLEVA
jgi:maltooligosyltrehalose trehalohydrolase